MPSMSLICEHHVSFDVCTNSGYLLAAFKNMQQEGGSLREALEVEGFSLVKHESSIMSPIRVSLTFDGQAVVLGDNGEMHYTDGTGWYECLIAPPG